MDTDKTALRRQDFWTALLLIAVALFFLARTAKIPFFKAAAAGVESGQWYNSAAIVPYLIFSSLLLLGIGLLVVAIREGGRPHSLPPIVGMWANPATERVGVVSSIILLYIYALVPRVDFVLSSALVITALIFGFHQMRRRALFLALAAVTIPSVYALVMHLPQSEWNKPLDDDWVTLVAYVALSVAGLIEVRRSGIRPDGFMKAAPAIALIVPLFLICVMAFGFRQNVPNRTGLIFSQIQYHYYVTLKPLWHKKG